MRWTLKTKLKLTAAMAGTAMLFGWFGFAVLVRVDPAGAFVFDNMAARSLALVLLIGLACMTALLGQLWLQRDLPHASWLIVGAGWLGVALRSPPIDRQLIYLASGGPVRGFYLRLIVELGALFAVTAVACALARWAGRMIPEQRGKDAHAVPLDYSQEPGGLGLARRGPSAAQAPADADRPAGDSLTDLLANLLGASLLAVAIYLLLINNSPIGDHVPGPIRRGQVLFALAGAFFLGALASHQVFPTRNPLGLILAVPLTAVACYLFAALGPADRRFAYQAPLRLAWPMPIDFLGLALPAATAAFLVSVRLVQIRQENARGAAS